MFGFLKKKPVQPPSRSQVTLCERLGLEITPKMGREDVSRMLATALQQDKYKNIYDAIQREKEAELEKEDRETYGDDLVDELKGWESRCDPYKQYLLVFRRGKTLQCDIVELEAAEIAGDKKHFVQLSFLRPKQHKERDTGTYYEWENELVLKPSQVLKLEELPSAIDMFDLDAFEEAKKKCVALASEFNA